MPESVSTRAAAVVGVAGFGLAAVLAGAVLAAGGSASAAATCAATPTDSPTGDPSATDSPSADPSDSASPVPSSTTNSNGSIVQAVTDLLPLGNGQGTTTGSPEPSSTDTAEPSDSATPEPTSTASTTVTLAPRRVVKGDPVRITGTGLPGCHVQVLGYTRPNTTYKVVRTGTVADNGKFSFTVYPPSNTRVYARSQGANDSKSTTVNVRFVVSLKVTRVGVKTYRFEGGVGPGSTGVHVTVYRTSTAGTFKVGSADTASGGAYSLVHQFSGTGTFSFYAVAETTTNNDSNRSALVQSSIS